MFELSKLHSNSKFYSKTASENEFFKYILIYKICLRKSRSEIEMRRCLFKNFIWPVSYHNKILY